MNNPGSYPLTMFTYLGKELRKKKIILTITLICSLIDIMIFPGQILNLYDDNTPHIRNKHNQYYKFNIPNEISEFRPFYYTIRNIVKDIYEIIKAIYNFMRALLEGFSTYMRNIWKDDKLNPWWYIYEIKLEFKIKTSKCKNKEYRKMQRRLNDLTKGNHDFNYKKIALGKIINKLQGTANIWRIPKRKLQKFITHFIIITTLCIFQDNKCIDYSRESTITYIILIILLKCKFLWKKNAKGRTKKKFKTPPDSLKNQSNLCNNDEIEKAKIEDINEPLEIKDLNFSRKPKKATKYSIKALKNNLLKGAHHPTSNSTKRKRESKTSPNTLRKKRKIEMTIEDTTIVEPTFIIKGNGYGVLNDAGNSPAKKDTNDNKNKTHMNPDNNDENTIDKDKIHKNTPSRKRGHENMSLSPNKKNPPQKRSKAIKAKRKSENIKKITDFF